MSYFSVATFQFLESLAQHNQREWFEQHKPDYETRVRGPALDLISDMTPLLRDVSPHFNAQAKKVGGSLMRVQRDIRFSHNKDPYKTNIGIQFRHELGKDVHAPSFYLHIANDECFIGVGMWQPDAEALNRIRQMMIEHEADWCAARDEAGFRQLFALTGARLSKPPRGYDKQHPLIEDLKWKDFIAVAPLSREQVCSETLLTLTLAHFQAAAPFMRFLCRAIDAAY